MGPAGIAPLYKIRADVKKVASDYFQSAAAIAEEVEESLFICIDVWQKEEWLQKVFKNKESPTCKT